MFRLFAATIAMFISIAVLIPIIPQYIHSVLLANDFAVGVIMAMQAIGAISSRMIVGNIISAHGTRKTIIIGSYICTLGGLAYFLPSNLWTLGLARLLQGIGEGLAFTAGTTWVLNDAPANSRGQFMAYYGLCLWLGATFGPPLGALVTHHFGFPGAWALAALTSGIGIPLISFTRQNHEKSVENTRLEWIAPEALRPGLTLCLASAGYVAIATFGTLYFTSRGWGGGTWPIAAFGMGFVIMRFSGGRLLDRMDVKVVAIYSIIIEALGLLGVTFAPTAHIVILSSFITGLGLALLYPALAVAAVHGVKSHRQGTVIGWYTAFWDLSLLSSNVLFGWLSCILGYTAVFLGGFFSAIVALICVLSWKNPILPKSRPEL